MSAIITDEMLNRRMKRGQYRMLVTAIIGYTLFYFLRKNLSLAMPGLAQDYGITKTSLGLFLTIHGVVYGLGKFVNGPWCDRSSARKFMLGGLMAVLVLNVAFGMGPVIAALIAGGASGAAFTSSLIAVLGVIWVANGFFQSMGNPPCVKLLSHWVKPSELATKLMIWNASHSIGAGLVSVMCGYIMSMGALGEKGVGVGMWRWCFWAPAIVVAAGWIILYFFLPNTPEEEGLPPIVEVENKAPEKATEEKPSGWNREEMIRKVYKNPAIWLVSLSCFMVYSLRFAILDWGPMLLNEAKHVSLAGGGWTVAAFEIAGIFGALSSGWVTDRFAGGRGPRVCLFMTLGAGLCMAIFWFLPVALPVWMYMIPLAGAGFFIYGPQGLTGATAINLATNRYAGTVIGLTSLFSYGSVIISGWGMGFLAEKTGGWGVPFIGVLATAVIGCVIFGLLWNTKPNGYEES